MNATSSLRLDDTTTLHAQRACFTPSNRELSLLLQASCGRGIDEFEANELAIARVVFAQVALMAGAALVADSETYFGAEQLWRDMQERIGARERALAKRFLELLSKDPYYSECERRLIAALARTLPEFSEGAQDAPASAPAQVDEIPIQKPVGQAVADSPLVAIERPKMRPPVARESIKLDEQTIGRLRTQRDGFAPSTRELTMLLQSEHGRGLDAFASEELEIARVVFAQVALMTGAALAADTETYIGAEQLWCDMQESIGPRERTLARHFLDLLSKDRYYTASERCLIESLAEALPSTEELPQRGRPDHAQSDAVTRLIFS